MESQISVKASYLTKPTATSEGIIGIKIIGNIEVTNKPINISLLIDSSGSMEGIRIDSVKKTLKVLVETLSNEDIITLITFSSNSKVILEKVLINDSNRSSIFDEIEKINAEGGTNLEKAFCLLGTLQITNSNAIVMLSDGYINEGMSNTASLYSLVKYYMPQLPIYTLGYGDDHNADLMKILSTKTHGSYNFIQEELSLPAAVGEMLGGLKTEISSNATVKFPTEWKCIEPYAEPTNSFSVGSIISNKPMWVMLNVPANSVDKAMELTYLTENGATTISFNTEDNSLERMELLEQSVRCEMGKIMNNVTDLMKSNQLTKSKELLTKAISTLEISEAKNRHMVILIKAEMEGILDKINIALTQNIHERTPAPLLRYTTNTSTNYGNQRGVSSGGGEQLFTTPTTRNVSLGMTVRFAQDPVNIPSNSNTRELSVPVEPSSVDVEIPSVENEPSSNGEQQPSNSEQQPSNSQSSPEYKI